MKHLGYEVIVPIYSKNERKDWVRYEACVYLVEKEQSLKQMEHNPMFTIPSTTLHRFVHKRLPDISPELYEQVCEQFKKNLERRYIRK